MGNCISCISKKEPANSGAGVPPAHPQPQQQQPLQPPQSQMPLQTTPMTPQPMQQSMQMQPTPSQPQSLVLRRKQMRALFSFEKQVEGDLSFKKDDILELIDNSDEFWWKMSNPETGDIGYVPYNYVQPFDGGPTSMASWFDVDRREAERNLLMPGLQEGTFLLRPCRQRADQAAFSLSVRTEELTQAEGRQILVKHYMVKPTDENGFYISPRKIFASMQNLVRHYQNAQDGLCCRLTMPCPRKYVPPPQFRDFELNRKQLNLTEMIGRGSFGEVWKAKLGRLVEVAVKMMHSNGQGISMNKHEFIGEAKTMHKLHHPKIVQLLGVCTTEEPFYIVTELMPNGALTAYLKKDDQNGRSITFDNMLDMLFQIADGMSYLEEKKFIHRDLRAANILVGYDNVVKVSDFGLSRLMEEDAYDIGENTKFPIRWTAPEAATEKVFTNKSDVWSFGVLIYEIVTRGRTPYPEYNNRDILRMVSRGYRMKNPRNELQGIHCEDFLYQNIMLVCWNMSPSDRPTFATLRGIFENYYVEKQHQYE